MSVIKFNLNNEIRRVTVQKQPTFEELSELLKRLYGNKLSETFALRYVDSEGDLVTLSTSEELEEAFRNFADKPIARFSVVPNKKEEEDEEEDDDEEDESEQLRAFFAALLGAPQQRQAPRPQAACPLFAPRSCGPCPQQFQREKFAQRPSGCPFRQQQQQKTEEKVAHAAFCDHCNNRIFGLRFKCTTCPDFDLCEKCFPQKNEKHDASHLFLRIARPLPPQYRYARPCAKQEAPATTSAAPSKTEETKAESLPIKIEVAVPKEPEVSLPEEKVEEPVKTEEALIITEPEPVEAPAPEEKKELSPFEAKLKQLEEMGFVDRERNINVLVKRSGDLVKAIRDLLE